ncbi:MAG TPA: DUF4169 family protein [Methylovirgula sp.]
MSGEIVNLRRVRKTKQRNADADAAAENRVRFGQSKTQRALAVDTEKLATRRFEAHRRESPAHVDNGQSAKLPRTAPDGA